MAITTVGMKAVLHPEGVKAGLKEIEQAAQNSADAAGNATRSVTKATGEHFDAVQRLQEADQKLAAAERELAAAEKEVGDVAQRAGRQAKEATDEHTAAVNRTRNSAEGLEDDLEDVGAAARDATEDMDHLGDAGERMGDEISFGADRARDSAAGLGSGMSFLKDSFDLARDASELLLSAIQALAEQGNPAAIELQSAFASITSVLFEFAEDPRFLYILDSVAKIIKEDLTPALRQFFDNTLTDARNARDLTASWGVYLAELAGIVDEGTYAILLADQERQKQLDKNTRDNVANKNKERDATRELIDVEQTLLELERQRQSAGRTDALGEIKTQEEIADIIADAKEALQDQTISEERKKELLDLIQKAEQRSLEIAKETKRTYEEQQREKEFQEKAAAAEAERERKRIEERNRADAEKAKRDAEEAQREEAREKERQEREAVRRKEQEERERRREENDRRRGEGAPVGAPPDPNEWIRGINPGGGGGRRPPVVPLSDRRPGAPPMEGGGGPFDPGEVVGEVRKMGQTMVAALRTVAQDCAVIGQTVRMIMEQYEMTGAEVRRRRGGAF